jgi:hypothetical protein
MYDSELLASMIPGLNSDDSILPKLLYGSNNIIKEIPPPTRNNIDAIRMIYLSLLKGWVNLYLNLFLNLIAMNELISCNVPSGHIVEQYTLPNSTVNNIIIINPIPAIAGYDINFSNDGINCKYNTELNTFVGNKCVISKNAIVVTRKKSNETTTRIFFSMLSFIIPSLFY